MKKIWSAIKYAYNYVLLTIKLIFMRMSIALHNTEQEVLKADPNDLAEKDKKNQKVLTRNPLHRKMEQGQKDQQYYKDFYQVLKKADEFMKNATPEQMEEVGRRENLTIGMTDKEIKDRAKVGKLAGENNKKLKKDKWGRRYDHFGFFDGKSKNAGKTLGEVLQEEIKQRKTKDDEYPIEMMFSNKPIFLGYTNNSEIVEDEKFGFRALNEYEKSKLKKYPLKVNRTREDVANKIEQLTEFVHVKRINDEVKIVEFFIPAKFGVGKLELDSEIFKEIIDIDMIWLKDQYDKEFGYNISDFKKMVDVEDESITDPEKDKVIYNVIKLNAKLIEVYNYG